MYLDVGTVVGSYLSGMSVDVLTDDGSRLANVQVMGAASSDQTGTLELPDVGGPLDDTRWSHTATFTRNVRAVISYLHRVPVCIGFLFPQETQMTFSDKNRRITRHASDVYTSVDDSGNFELFHPSGTYLRIGSSPSHEDLTGTDVDKLWKIARNTTAAPYVHLGVYNAGASVSSLEFDPSGNVALQANANVTADVGGNVTATVKGNVTATITGTFDVVATGSSTLKSPTVTIDSPETTCTGALTVQGALTFEAGATGQAGSAGGAAIKLTGAMEVDGTVTSTGDQVAGSISQIGHLHSGVQSGSSNSGGPVST